VRCKTLQDYIIKVVVSYIRIDIEVVYIFGVFPDRF